MIRKLLIADDQPICAEALRSAVHAIDGAIEVSLAGSLAAVEHALARSTFAALVLDLALSDSAGLLNLSLVRARQPDLPVLIASSCDSPSVVARVQALGARGFVSKRAPVSVVQSALSVVLQGGQWFPHIARDGQGPAAELGRLSPAQTRVMIELGRGQPNKIIAHNLHLAEATVKSHLSAIYRALEVSNRSQAILALRQMDA